MVKSNFFFYAIGVLLMISCVENSDNSELKAEQQPEIRIDTLLNNDSINLSVSYIGDTAYNFISKTAGKEYKYDTQDIFPSGLPKIIWYNSHWIYLRGGCGSSCFYGYILSLKEGKLKMYTNPLYTDYKTEIIIYCIESNLRIENFYNNKYLDFSNSILKGPYCGYKIDNIRIEQGFLFFDISSSESKLAQKISIKSLVE